MEIEEINYNQLNNFLINDLPMYNVNNINSNFHIISEKDNNFEKNNRSNFSLFNNYNIINHYNDICYLNSFFSLNKKINSNKKKATLFKNGKNSFHVEKDIRDFKRFCEGLKCSLPEYICTQIGSRIMQKYLSRFPYFIITKLIEKIFTYFEKIMTDIYGNYFCQKLYKISSTEQRMMILRSLADSFINISKTKSGSHVSQSIIEQSKTKEEKQIIMEYIRSHEMELALDCEGTHVLQKIIEVFPEEEKQSIIDIICTKENVNKLSKDIKGISVIKRLIKFTKEKDNQIKMAEAILSNCLEISKSSSGSYIIQYLLEQWGVNIGFKIIIFSISNFESFILNKNSVNLLDKIILICLQNFRMNGSLEKKKNDNNNEVIILNNLKNIVFDSNKISNYYKNRYGKNIILKIRKLFNADDNAKLYSLLKSLESLTNYRDIPKYKIYKNLFNTQ